MLIIVLLNMIWFVNNFVKSGHASIANANPCMIDLASQNNAQNLLLPLGSFYTFQPFFHY